MQVAYPPDHTPDHPPALLARLKKPLCLLNNLLLPSNLLVPDARLVTLLYDTIGLKDRFIAAFTKFDLNGNGYIEPNELQYLSERLLAVRPEVKVGRREEEMGRGSWRLGTIHSHKLS